MYREEEKTLCMGACERWINSGDKLINETLDAFLKMLEVRIQKQEEKESGFSLVVYGIMNEMLVSS